MRIEERNNNEKCVFEICDLHISLPFAYNVAVPLLICVIFHLAYYVQFKRDENKIVALLKKFAFRVKISRIYSAFAQK
jgi:type IV secretory pathway VirB3-like protein